MGNLIKQGPQGITLAVGDVETRIPAWSPLSIRPVPETVWGGTFAANLALKMVPIAAARTAQLVTQRLIAEQGRQLWHGGERSPQPGDEILG